MPYGEADTENEKVIKSHILKFFIKIAGKLRLIHVYRQEFEPQVAIMSTDNSFRCSDSYKRNPGETCHIGAVLIRNKCIYCGKEMLSWCKKEYYESVLKDDEFKEQNYEVEFDYEPLD